MKLHTARCYDTGTTFTCNRMPYHLKIVWKIYVAKKNSHLTTKLQNVCRVWYNTQYLHLFINTRQYSISFINTRQYSISFINTRQYYRNTYLREIWNCFFHAQAIFLSQSLYKKWPKSKKKQKQNKNKKNKTKIEIYTKTVCHFDDGFCHTL